MILSEEYEDKGTIKMIVDNAVVAEGNLGVTSMQKQMIGIAVGVVFLKIIWNVVGGYGVGHEIHLTTLFVFWGMYDAIKKNRYENLAISVWVFVSVEVLNFRYKPISQIYYLIIFFLQAISITSLAFKWKKERLKISDNKDQKKDLLK